MLPTLSASSKFIQWNLPSIQWFVVVLILKFAWNLSSILLTRPNQVRTLTVIKSLFLKWTKHSNVHSNEQNVQMFIQLNKMFKCSFKWSKCSRKKSPEKVIPRTVWWRLKRWSKESKVGNTLTLMKYHMHNFLYNTCYSNGQEHQKTPHKSLYISLYLVNNSR